MCEIQQDERETQLQCMSVAQRRIADVRGLDSEEQQERRVGKERELKHTSLVHGRQGRKGGKGGKAWKSVTFALQKLPFISISFTAGCDTRIAGWECQG